MAHSSDKQSSYYFKQTAPNIWEINKFDGARGGDADRPSAEYEIKGNPYSSGDWACTCPASWGGKNRRAIECKHGELLRRWMDIQSSKAHRGKVIYYNSADNRFYVAPGLDLE